MNILTLTNSYPGPHSPSYGIFVQDGVEALRRAGCSVDVYFVNGRANRLRYLAMPLGLAARLRRRDYDLIHVHHSLCAFVAAKQRRIPVIWTCHEGSISEDFAFFPLAREIGWLRALTSVGHTWRRLGRRVDGLVVVNQKMREVMSRPDALALPCSVDLERFVPMDSDSAKRAVGLDPNRRYVLFPGSRHRPEKRYAMARAAVDRVRARGAGLADLELLTLEDEPRERVSLFMNASDLVLLCSQYEGAPLVVREALACNVPVVSTPVGDVPQVLAGIEGCRITMPGVDLIADAVSETLLHGGHIEGRARVEKMSLDRNAEVLVRYFRRVLDSRRL